MVPVTDKVADAFASFRARPAAEALPELLANPHLKPDQRAMLVRSYTNYLFDPPLQINPVARYLTGETHEPAVAVAGLEVLAATGHLTDPKAITWVVGLLDSADMDTRLTALQAVEEARLATASQKLSSMLADTNRPVAERSAVAGDPEARSAGENERRDAARHLQHRVAARGPQKRAVAGIDGRGHDRALHLQPEDPGREVREPRVEREAVTWAGHQLSSRRFGGGRSSSSSRRRSRRGRSS